MFLPGYFTVSAELWEFKTDSLKHVFREGKDADFY